MQGNRVHPLQTHQACLHHTLVQKRLVWDNLTIAQAAPKLFICLCHVTPTPVRELTQFLPATCDLG